MKGRGVSTVLVLLLGLLLSQIHVAQAAPNMTVINTIHASYINPLTGRRIHAYSNTVSVTLLPVANVHLQSNVSRNVAPNQMVQIPHRLSNFGNIPDSFSLSLVDSANDDADLEALGLYHDINANGKLDAGEPKVSQFNNLAPSDTRHLLIVGIVPKSVSEGMMITLTLLASSLNSAILGNKIAINSDSLLIENNTKLKRSNTNDDLDSTSDPAVLEQNLVITAEASKTTVMIGDMVRYTVHLSNKTDSQLSNLYVHNLLPQGLKLLQNTIYLNGEKYVSTITPLSGRVDFNIGAIDHYQEISIRYSARVTASIVTIGDNEIINSVYLTANNLSQQKIKSKQVHAKVKLENINALSNKGTIFGKVHFDKRCNYKPKRDKGLLAISGVQIFLDDGRYTITDGAGDYSFSGLDPERYVVKVDAVSLPEGGHLKLTSHQQMKDARSHLIDLKNSHFIRADFVLDCLKGKNKQQQLAVIRKKNINLSDTDYLSDTMTSQQDKNLIASEITLTQHKKDKILLSKEVVKTITNQQAKKGQWLWPKQAFSVDGRFMAVVRADVKLPILTVNGNVIAIEQLGEQIMNRKARGQVLAWYGIKLKKGENHLEIKGIDGRGKMLSLLKGTFKQPSEGVSIRITPLKKVFIADGGKSTLPLQVTIFDQQGYPALGDYFLTVAASDGTWLEPDLQDMTAGHQIKISDGQGKIHLRSSRQSGRIKIAVKADALEGKTEVTQKAHLRPLFVTGYLNLQAGFDGSKNSRAKIFMQGKVLKDTHLTLSFDSNKKDDTEHAAFIKEIDDSFYPLKGDASLQGHKARSRNKLFVKLEKNQHKILYGDYQTEALSSVDLAKVRRSLTGVKINSEFGKTRLQAHVAEERNRHVVEEFRGNGTASNYQLKNKRLIPHSEIIEMVIRDRNNRGIVWYTETLKAMHDYSLDPVTGYLSFHRVIPSFDDKLNPVFIRVSYTQESEGKKYLIAGANVEYKVSDEVALGASYHVDKHEEDGNKLAGAYVKYNDIEGGNVSVSAARMLHEKSGTSGNAYQIIADKQWSKESRSELKIARANTDFRNSAGGISAGRQEVKLNHTQKISKKSNLEIEALQNKSLTANRENKALGVKVQTRNGKWLLEGGVRHITKQEGDKKERINTVMASAKRTTRIFGKSARLGASYEQDIEDEKRHYAALTADLAVTKDTSLYARYESGKGMIESLDSLNENHSKVLVVGAKNKLTPKLEAYSEYRAKQLGSADSSETASGLRGSITLEKGLTVSPTLEVVKVVEGATLNNAVSASVKIKDVRDPNNKKYLRLETRQGKNSDYYALNGNYIKRLDDVWSGFIGEEVRITKPEDKDANGSHALTLGVGQRPRDEGKHNALYLYQWKEERTGEKSGDSSTHILSSHQNYQINEDITLSGRAAGKWQKNQIENNNYYSDTVLLDAKASYEINDKVDVFARGGVIGSNGFDEQRYSAGLGVNVNIDRNVSVGVAYNTTGFKDKDLDPDTQNKAGVFLNLSLKADENMFDWLDWKKKKKSKSIKAIPIPVFSPAPELSYKTAKPKREIPVAAPKQYVAETLSGNSYFDTGSATLSWSGKQALNSLAKKLKQSYLMRMEVVVIGHTDSVGKRMNNQILSEKRAESVAVHLTQLGLDLLEMDIVGQGETQPIASNKTKAGRASNRRVNIYINGVRGD